MKKPVFYCYLVLQPYTNEQGEHKTRVCGKVCDLTNAVRACRGSSRYYVPVRK